MIPWAYEGVARALVLRLKLRGCAASADAIAAELAVAARETGLVGSVVAWVPGRPRESARRGLDHAEAIARRTAYRLGLPAVPLIQRRADTVDQTHLNARERRSNLTGAFSARPCKCHVVLVDDLVTTGATAEACAAALRAAGASGVELLAACRA